MNEPKKKRGRPPGSKGKAKEPIGNPKIGILKADGTIDTSEETIAKVQNDPAWKAAIKSMEFIKPVEINKKLASYDPFSNPRFIAKMKIKE